MKKEIKTNRYDVATPNMIRQFLEKLQLAAKKLEEGERPPKESFADAVEFARNFTDRFHHFKEEYVLFGHLALKKSGQIGPHPLP